MSELEQINSNVILKTREQKYEHELSIQPKVCDQYKTGRCWIFASLNCMRLQIIKEYNLDLDFEFSANYLFFWDKYERCKYFLTEFPNFNETDEMYNQMLFSPVTDAGQWNMFVNLVNKYGVVPKTCFEETYSSKSSKSLNKLLNNKLKKSIINSDPIHETMAKIYKILIKYLGDPPSYVKWEEFNISPKKYYMTCIKPYYDVNNFVNLINDPRNEYNEFYTVDNLTNMINTRGPIYYNMSMDKLIKYTKKSIKADEPVWFTCDMSKYTSNLYCVNGPSFFKNSIKDELTKKERLTMLDSSITHAMVLHGFSKDKWKIENSWGSIGINNGYYIADNTWIKQYVYQMIIPRKLVQKLPHVKTPKQLPYFDPFGFINVI